MASSLAMLFVWLMLFPTGAAVLWGLLGPNQMPILALAFLSPFRSHEPSMKATMSGGLLILGLCLASSNSHFVGVVKMQKLLYMWPVVVTLGSKILTLQGWPAAYLDTDTLSSSDRLLLSRWSSTYRLNFGVMLFRAWLASLKHAFGWVHPAFFYLPQ